MCSRSSSSPIWVSGGYQAKLELELIDRDMTASCLAAKVQQTQGQNQYRKYERTKDWERWSGEKSCMEIDCEPGRQWRVGYARVRELKAQPASPQHKSSERRKQSKDFIFHCTKSSR